MLSVSLDEDNIIPYIINTLNNQELALKLASRGGLPGADNLYIQRFQTLFNSHNFTEAAKVAANSPRVSRETWANRDLTCLIDTHSLNRVFFVPPRRLKSLDRSLLLPTHFHPFYNTLALSSKRASSTNTNLSSLPSPSSPRTVSLFWKSG